MELLWHLTVTEIGKILVCYLFLPLLTLIVLYLLYRYSRLRLLLLTWRAKLVHAYLKVKFNRIFVGTSKKQLNGQYIANALSLARASNAEHKQTAIQQLAQFSEDTAFDGLIRLLSDENDEAFKYLIVEALHMVVKRRISNNEH